MALHRAPLAWSALAHARYSQARATRCGAMSHTQVDPMPLSPIPVAQSATATPREIRPVVHARLRANHAAQETCRVARDLAWQWVASKWPRLLPSTADMAAHHCARNAPGQWLVADGQDGAGWTMTVGFDERHGGRSWVTRVEIGQDAGLPLLALQTGCTAPEKAPLTVAPPRLLGSWVERLDLVDGPVAVISEPRAVGNPRQLEHFLAHVAAPARTLPIIALTNRPNTRFFGVDPAGLAMAVRGLAHVACLSPEVADELAARLGPHLGVVPGAARIYGAGAPITASSGHHPLVRHHHSGDNASAHAGAFRRQLCQRICALSVRHLAGASNLEPGPRTES